MDCNNIIFDEINNENMLEALDIYLANTEFFSLVDDYPSIDNIKNELNNTPLGINYHKKIYSLIKYKNKTIGVLDILLGYPESNATYIGLLLIKEKNKKYGKKSFEKLQSFLKENNYSSIKLAVLKNNPRGLNFWYKIDFIKVSEKYTIINNKKYSVYELSKNI